MDLSEFVKQTLEDVTQGVYDAQASCEGRALIGTKWGRQYQRSADGSMRTKAKLFGTQRDFEFDVAVGVIESTEKGGKAAITVFGVGLGGGVVKEAQMSTTHRIKFSVPVVFLPAGESV